MVYGLDRDTIKKMLKVFSGFNKIERVVIYGSRAKGDYRDESDIDLALFGAEASSHDLPEIAWALDDLLLPYKIDLVLYDSISNLDLKAHIDRCGKPFFNRLSPDLSGNGSI